MKRSPDRPYHQPGVLRVLQTRAETRKFYDKIAKVYDLLAEHAEGPLRQEGLRMLAVRPGETALEIGFGTGHVLAELARAAGPRGTVLGIDISEKMVDLARRLLRQEGLAGRVRLVQADAARLPCRCAAADAVFSGFTLELFDTPEIPVVLGECRRALRPGGRIVIVSLSRLRPDGVMTQVYEWTHRHFPNLLDCRPILARRAVEDAGFRIEAAEVREMWGPVEIVLGVKP